MDNAVTTTPQVTFPEMGKEICTFSGEFKDMRVGRNGALILSFIVPLKDKYNALPVTNFPGMVLRLKVSREVIVYSESVLAEAKELGLIDDEFAPGD